MGKCILFVHSRYLLVQNSWRGVRRAKALSSTWKDTLGLTRVIILGTVSLFYNYMLVLSLGYFGNISNVNWMQIVRSHILFGLT